MSPYGEVDGEISTTPDHAHFPWNDRGEYPELEKINKVQRDPNMTGRRHAVQHLSPRPRPRVDIGTCPKTEIIARGGPHQLSSHTSVSPGVLAFAQLVSVVRLAARRRQLPQRSVS
ncbi:MAG: hypothetical protein ACK5X3_08580 [Pseudomonadota bacterium]|jgi:hypothetical protein